MVLVGERVCLGEADGIHSDDVPGMDETQKKEKKKRILKEKWNKRIELTRSVCMQPDA